jgi:hypothetical protein
MEISELFQIIKDFVVIIGISMAIYERIKKKQRIENVLAY